MFTNMCITFNIVFITIINFSSELNDLKPNDLQILVDLIKSIHKEKENELDDSNRVNVFFNSDYNENNKLTTPTVVPFYNRYLIERDDTLRNTENNILRGKSSESSQSINKELDSHENETLPHIQTNEVIDITAENDTMIVKNMNYMREDKAEIKCLEACEDAYEDVCRTHSCTFRMRQKFKRSCVVSCRNRF